MRLLISCEDLRVGGAQTFVLRLAQALSAQHKVYVYSHYCHYILWDMVKRLAPDVEVVYCSIPAAIDFLIRKFDRLLFKLTINFSFREWLISQHIRRIVDKYNIQIIHSNMFKSDYVFANALRNKSIPLIITSHGDYEIFFSRFLKEAEGEVVLGYPRKVKKMLSRINSLVYLTEKNLNILKSPHIFSTAYVEKLNLQKIYNGFPEVKLGFVSGARRKELAVKSDAIVYGMVARGVPEKGWEECIEAFILLKEKIIKPIHLILVGGSSYVDSLKLKYASYNNIHFIGYSDNPLEWIDSMDVCLLPTQNDCLPNSIIEYLYLSKPVISTKVGEIERMLTYEDKQAGYTLSLDLNKAVNIRELRKAMEVYIINKELLMEHKRIARLAFKKFEMQHCVSQYNLVYQSALECRTIRD